MIILLSPAKNMVEANDDFVYRDLPLFIQDAQYLKEKLLSLTDAELKSVWKCSEKLFLENKQKLQHMDLKNNLSPALFSYHGLAFQHMTPGAFTYEELDYVQEHLRILSAFYGIVRPFDGIVSYRLEMGSSMPDTGSLYDYWKDRIYEACNDSVFINLASKEYSDAVKPYLKKTDQMITCYFMERKNNKLIQKGTKAKMARGAMVYWMACHQVKNPEELKNFDEGYLFSPSDSDDCSYIFLEKKK